MSNDIYDSAFTTAQQPMRLSGLDTFETKTDDGKTIAGHHFMESPHKFSDIGNNVTFQDDVTFTAAIAQWATRGMLQKDGKSLRDRAFLLRALRALRGFA
jgi:hypothetical protein